MGAHLHRLREEARPVTTGTHGVAGHAGSNAGATGATGVGVDDAPLVTIEDVRRAAANLAGVRTTRSFFASIRSIAIWRRENRRPGAR